MKSRRLSDWAVELTIGALTLVFATLAFLVTSPVLGALALVTGGMSYGIVIARRPGNK